MRPTRRPSTHAVSPRRMSRPTGTLLILGPQRPRPNLAAALVEAGASGPIGVVTAGWRHDESELAPLRRDLPFEPVLLPLYGWFDRVMNDHPELRDAYRLRQARVLAMKSLYRVRLSLAFQAVLRVHKSATGFDDLDQAALLDAVEVLRALDASAAQACDDIRAGFPSVGPDHPAVRPLHDELAALLSTCNSLAIAGGHVAVLLNRIRFFGLDRLLEGFLARGGVLAAWSAGAMVLGPRVVLFYDDPPEGPSEPEVLDRGLCLFADRLLFPHARRRLRTDDPARLRLLRARFGKCLGLENGAWVEIRGSGFTDRSDPGSLLVLAPPEAP